MHVFRAEKSINLPLTCSDCKPSFILCFSFLFCPISVFTHSTTQYFQVPGISVPGNEGGGDEYNTDPSLSEQSRMSRHTDKLIKTCARSSETTEDGGYCLHWLGGLQQGIIDREA